VSRAPERLPDESDVRLDDLVEDAPGQPSAIQTTGARAANAAPDRKAKPAEESLALDAASGAATPAGHVRLFFAGNLPVNVLAGALTGAHVFVVCLALAMLALTADASAGLMPHALILLLVPAILGSLLLALIGRLPVAVGAPEPAAVLCVFLLLSALGADMAGRVPAQDITATLTAGLALATLLSGLLGCFFSRLGVAERMRYLPIEILSGLLAGFGLLLLKAWGSAMLVSSPALAELSLKPLAELGPALAQAWPEWAPALALGLACFLVHMSVRGLLWPLLVMALAIAAWNALTLGLFSLPGPLAALQSALTGPQARLPQMLDTGCFTALFDSANVSRIHWPALAARVEYFAAVAAMAILPSIIRTPILESVLNRDADGGGQMRVVGASSLLSGLLGAMPASLSLSGSLGLRGLGASGPMAGFTVGLACLAALLAGQPVLAFIPAFVPLGVLLAIGLILPVSWMLRDARNPLTRKRDLQAAWVSCLFVVVLGPVLGVFSSLGLGLLLSLSRAVAGGGVRFAQSGDVFHSNVERSPAEQRILRERGAEILVLRLHGYLLLGIVYGLVQRVRERLRVGQPLRYVLLDFGAVEGLGASSAIGFRRLEALARENGLLIFITSVPLEVEQHLEGLGYHMGDDAGVCRMALNLDYALEWCEDAILAGAAVPASDGSGGLAELLPELKRDTLEEMLAATFPEPALVPALMKCLERGEVPRKRHVVRQGDASDAMYFLQSGKVHVELALPGGKVMRLKKMGPGTVFGEMGLYTSAPRSASVIAVERCVVYKLSLARFRLIQAKAPQLAAAVNRFVVALLAERVAEANAQARASQN